MIFWKDTDPAGRPIDRSAENRSPSVDRNRSSWAPKQGLGLHLATALRSSGWNYAAHNCVAQWGENLREVNV